ncbi:hypothetical protein RSAG8_01819, partial [Rhizoctonia solani AG-8 WAC10335]
MPVPTLKGVTVNSVHSALIIFYAVSLKLLPKVEQRLNVDERESLTTGDVYVWEERDLFSDTGESIERWTDGIKWGSSRVRNEFLFYYERDHNPRESQAIQEGRLIKQTFSVYFHPPGDPHNRPRKWHMVAYYSQATVDGALLAQGGSKMDQTGDSSPVAHARILATDLSSAVELIDHNKVSNSHLFNGNTSGFEGPEETRRTCEIELHAAELDWDSAIPSSVWPSDRSSGAQYPFDIIIMADVTYNTASFEVLLDTVTGLLRGPSAPGLSAIVLLAYKYRDPAERTLWIDAQSRGITFVLVDTVKGVREPAVEIWLGGWERDVRSLWSDTH